MGNVIHAEDRFHIITDEEAHIAAKKMFQELYGDKLKSFEDELEEARQMNMGFKQGSTGFPSEAIAHQIVEGKDNVPAS